MPIYAEKEGYLSRIDSLTIGVSSMKLGGGRARMDEAIDMSAGILLNKKIGDHVNKGELLATCCTNKEKVEEVLSDVLKAFEIQTEKPAERSIVFEYIH